MSSTSTIDFCAIILVILSISFSILISPSTSKHVPKLFPAVIGQVICSRRNHQIPLRISLPHFLNSPLLPQNSYYLLRVLAIKSHSRIDFLVLNRFCHRDRVAPILTN